MNRTEIEEVSVLVVAAIFLGLVLAFLTFGCTALRDQTPKTDSLTLQGTPQELYPRALQAFANLGGTIMVVQPYSTISGQVHNAVTLTVTLVPVPGGTRVEAVGTLLPNKIASGSFSEVQDYLALLR